MKAHLLTNSASIRPIQRRIRTLHWCVATKRYANRQEFDRASVWLGSEDDYYEAVLGSAQHFDDEPDADGIVEQPECWCEVLTVQQEVSELSARLNENSLGEINPRLVTKGDLFAASLRHGMRRHRWAVLLTNYQSYVYHDGDFASIRLCCGKGHAGLVYWVPTRGWWVDDERSLRVSFGRDSRAAQCVKALYRSTCQRCRVTLGSPRGPIAEAAHVWEVHDGGPNTLNNLLCLCPNCHAQFDADSWSLIEENGFPCSIDHVSGAIDALCFDLAHRIEATHLRRRAIARNETAQTAA